jgi:hypothetical protein
MAVSPFQASPLRILHGSGSQDLFEAPTEILATVSVLSRDIPLHFAMDLDASVPISFQMNLRELTTINVGLRPFLIHASSVADQMMLILCTVLVLTGLILRKRRFPRAITPVIPL